MTNELKYEVFDELNLLVSGSKLKFHKHVSNIGGVWNTKVKGWLLPIVKKTELDSLISSLKKSGVISVPIKTYHREDSDDEESETDMPEIVPVFVPDVERRLSKASVPSPKEAVINEIDYYKSFNTKPKQFREQRNIETYSSDSETSGSDTSIYSSSSGSGSSSESDGFPDPRTPQKQHRTAPKETYEDLRYEIKNLQKRLSNIEIEKRRNR